MAGLHGPLLYSMAPEFLAEPIPAQTFAPFWMLSYCQRLADLSFDRDHNSMYLHMLEGFLEHEPWKAVPHFEWIKTMKEGGSSDVTWHRITMYFTKQLFRRIVSTIYMIETHGYASKLRGGLPLQTFLYTAVAWWVTCGARSHGACAQPSSDLSLASMQ